MALLDFLKNKKEKEKAKEKKAEKILDAKKEIDMPSLTKPLKAPKIVKSAKNSKNFSYTTIKEPHISEKATLLAEQGKYTFVVYNNVTKLEIKKAVEGIYGVDVLKVNVILIPHKKRRLGKTEGFKKAFQKAVVTIKEGQKIELF